MKNRIFRATLLIVIIWTLIALVSIQSCASKTYVFNESDMSRGYIQRNNVCDFIYDAMFADIN